MTERRSNKILGSLLTEELKLTNPCGECLVDGLCKSPCSHYWKWMKDVMEYNERRYNKRRHHGR